MSELDCSKCSGKGCVRCENTGIAQSPKCMVCGKSIEPPQARLCANCSKKNVLDKAWKAGDAESVENILEAEVTKGIAQITHDKTFYAHTSRHLNDKEDPIGSQRKTIVSAHSKMESIIRKSRSHNMPNEVDTTAQHGPSQTTVLDNYSSWVENTRRLCEKLNLQEAKKVFKKYCAICNEEVPSSSRENGEGDYLCLKHSLEYQHWRHSRNQARYRQRQKVTE